MYTKKLSHRYTASGNQTRFMYYYKLIINFRKLSSGRSFLYVNVNIPQSGIDLNTYPSQFKGNYLVAYGIVGSFSNIDPDKVYDYHTAFDIKPTEVVYNVDVNMNNKKILNFNTDESSNNNIATVGMINKIKPSIKFYIYRKYFKEFFDFSDAKCYNLVTSASGVVFNSISSISGDAARNITFPNKTIDDINHGSLSIFNYIITFNPPLGQTSYTMCLIFTTWPNRSWSLNKYDVTNSNSKNRLLRVYFTHADKKLYLDVSNTQKSLTVPNSFMGKNIVIWLTESISTPITKVNISNYSADLVINSASYSANQRFEYYNSATEIHRYMYSPNFYDVHGVEHHTILLEEKLLGNHVD